MRKHQKASVIEQVTGMDVYLEKIFLDLSFAKNSEDLREDSYENKPKKLQSRA